MEGEKADWSTMTFRLGLPRTPLTRPRVFLMYLSVVSNCVRPLLFSSSCIPSEVMLAWPSGTSGSVRVPLGKVSRIPGSGPRGLCPHSCTRDRNLSCAMVSLKIVAKADTMSALRWRMAKFGEAEVRSSEKHVSLFVCNRPEEEQVVIRCFVG